jgi:general secretion pathway protein I
LSAQAGLYAGGAYAQHTSIATGLLRCRMTEIEEKIAKLGLPEVEDKDDGACCDDDSRNDMKCEWKVERIELPTPDPTAIASASPTGTSGPGGPLSALMGGMGGPGAPGGASALSQLGFGSGSSMSLSSPDGGISGIASALKDGTGGGMGALAQLAMSIVYPTLKPMLEASIRKITVKVTWKEGIQKRDLTVIQYVTRPMRGDAITAAAAAAAGTGTLPGTPSPTATTPGLGVPGLGGLGTGVR